MLLLQWRMLGRCSDVLLLTKTLTEPRVTRRKNRLTMTTTAREVSEAVRLSVRLPLAVGTIPAVRSATAAAWPALPEPEVVAGVVWLQSVLPPPDPDPDRRRLRRRHFGRGHYCGSVCCVLVLVVVRTHWKRYGMAYFVTRKRTAIVERKRLSSSSADDFGFLGRNYYCYYY